MRAVVRGLASSFADAVSSHPLPVPIAIDTAQAQHETYVQLLRSLVRSATELPADHKHPGTLPAGRTALQLSVAAAAAAAAPAANPRPLT